MRYLTACLLLAGCGGSTGPSAQGLDPIVLIHNQSGDTVFFQWRDGQGIAGADTILPGATRCEKFLAQADSAYFAAQGSGRLPPYQFTYTQPWFDPATHPAWTMVASWEKYGGFLVTDVSPMDPC